MIAASALSSAAEDPVALSAIASGERDDLRSGPAQHLRFSHADALERWTVVASASHKPWEATDTPGLSRFDSRGVLGGEAARASLAFDWARNLRDSRVEAAAFARRSGLDLYSDLARFDGSSYAERFEQRDRRSALGAALRWTTEASLAGLPASHSASARVRSETLDADGAFHVLGREPFETVRADRLRQSGAALTFESEAQLAERLRAVAGVRYDSYRFGVASDLASHQGAASGTIASPHLSLVADLARDRELFITAGRGFRNDDPRAAGAATDPRNGAPIGRLDPLASAQTLEIGLRGRWGPAAESTVSMFRSKAGSELLLDGDTGVTELMRSTVRQGVQASSRYAPASWITLDFQVSALRARFADGTYIPGAAERSASAAATMRVRNGWTASLVVNYLGKRPALVEDSSPIKASTFVNGRLSRSLSKSTRVTFDVFNVFDQRVRNLDYFSTTRIWSQPGASDSFLFNPAEARGFRLKLRTTF